MVFEESSQPCRCDEANPRELTQRDLLHQEKPGPATYHPSTFSPSMRRVCHTTWRQLQRPMHLYRPFTKELFLVQRLRYPQEDPVISMNRTLFCESGALCL